MDPKQRIRGREEPLLGGDIVDISQKRPVKRNRGAPALYEQSPFSGGAVLQSMSGIATPESNQ